MDQDIVSFMLRFVREAGEDQQARWRGVIQHVQGTGEQQFSQFSQALEFMQAHVNETIRTTFAERDDAERFSPFLETARLWGEFFPAYQETVLDAMEEAARSSESAPQRFHQVMLNMMKSWGLPMEADQTEALERIEFLSERIEDLTKTVEALQVKVADLQSRSARGLKDADDSE